MLFAFVFKTPLRFFSSLDLLHLIPFLVCLAQFAGLAGLPWLVLLASLTLLAGGAGRVRIDSRNCFRTLCPQKRLRL